MPLRISIGQYYPAASPVHRLDPRVKVAGALVLMVTVFFIHTPAQLAFGFACTLALLALAHVPAGRVLRSVRPIVAVLAVLAVFELVCVREGDEVWRLGALAVTTGGIRAALLYTLRLVIAVIAGALLLLTTTPTQLTDAFDACLSPLARLGLPGHELAMVFSLMLRFIPTLADEASDIHDAQATRGAHLSEGSPAARLRSVGSLLVALLASSVRHADNLSRALDARCYEGGAARTHWHPLRMRTTDWLALVVMTAYVVALLALPVLAG